MVNLSRDTIPGSKLWERDNLVLKEVGEQGSVMKTVTLLSLVEDGHVTSLEQTIPTHHGVVPGYNQDTHILDYERLTGRSEITVKHGFEISSNYVFTYLPETYYGAQPQEFFDHIYAYRLGEKFDFDLDGLGTPVVNRPGTPGWSRTTLGTTAYGYGMSVTPLHVVTFYNAIANKGRMMKPYVVESVEKDGKVIKEYGPSVLNNICTRATADTVTRALKAVVDDGTATRLKNAKLSVAGKTGSRPHRERTQGQSRPVPRPVGPQAEPGYLRGLLSRRRPEIHHPRDGLFLPVGPELLRRHQAGHGGAGDRGQHLRDRRHLVGPRRPHGNPSPDGGAHGRSRRREGSGPEGLRPDGRPVRRGERWLQVRLRGLRPRDGAVPRPGDGPEER